jgi:hypothetical protein
MPQGATAVEANLEFLAPTFTGGFTSGSSTTSHLVVFPGIGSCSIRRVCVPTMSDRVAHFGLEHHQSNDSRVAERATWATRWAYGSIPMASSLT